MMSSRKAQGLCLGLRRANNLIALVALSACGHLGADGEKRDGADGGSTQVIDTDGDGIPDLSTTDADGDGTPDACVDEREFLATKAWPQVFAAKCMTCHGPGGPAQQKNAELALQPSAYPGFLDYNLENVRDVAKVKIGDTSRILLMARGQEKHEGGAVLAEDSAEYAVLEEFVAMLNSGEADDEKDEAKQAACAAAATASLAQVELLDAAGTLRKAALQLNGRLPKKSELRAVRDDEAALPGTIRALFEEDAFYERLLEVFNDQWLTDRYINNGQDLLSSRDFPNLNTYYDGLSDADRARARRSIAREPLELMAYVVRNNRPFTEIVTADYTVLNGFTAELYNANVKFDDAYNEHELKPGKILIEREREDQAREEIPWPHAGILSSPVFLNRYPTSRTNRNRHRARIVLREFLATDILKVADRPIDPTSAVTFPNPTQDDPTCKTCHVVIDPIAGAFQQFSDNDQEQHVPDREWYGDMAGPGFGTKQMTLQDIADNPLAWLGRQIADDPRFAISVVRNVYKSLTGQAPLEFPDDPATGAYAAWRAQDITIRAITDAFVADDYNLKTVIEGIVLSPYYRAKNTSSTAEGELAQQDAVGTAQLLTPELLNRKIKAVLGQEWLSGNNPALLGDYRILYGGIDSDAVTERLTTPNGVMSSIMWRMANEMSCRTVATDFARPQGDRRLFVDVELDTLPVNDLNREDEEGLAAIRSNITYLYDRFLGEKLAPDSEEAERALNLFLDTFYEGNSKLADDRIGTALPRDCQYRRDPATGDELPEAERLSDDPRYVMRSWMALTTYLLSDYRFLYE